MSNISERKMPAHDGKKVLSTTDMCKWLGVSLSCADLMSIAGVVPATRTATAIFWHECDRPTIARALAKHLTDKAAAVSDQCDAVADGADPFGVDFSVAPDWAICHVFDGYGNGFWYQARPEPHHSQPLWRDTEIGLSKPSRLKARSDNWQKSLRSKTVDVRFMSSDVSEGGDSD